MGLSRFLEMMLEYLGVSVFVTLYFRFYANPTTRILSLFTIISSIRLPLQSRSTCECCSPFVQLPSSHATVSKRTPSSFSPQFSPSTSVLFLLFSKVGKGGIGYNGLPTSRLQATYGKLYCRSTTHRRSSRSPQALVLPLALVLPDHIKLTLSTITLSSSVRAINIDTTIPTLSICCEK